MFDTGIVDQVIATLPSLESFLFFLRRTGDTVAGTPLPSLLFLAIVFFHVGQYTPAYLGTNDRCTEFAKTLGLLTFLGFCLQGYATHESRREEIGFYVTLGLRGFLVLIIVDGALRLLLPLALHISSIVTAPFRALRRLLTWLWRRVTTVVQWVIGGFRSLWTTTPPPPPPDDPLLVAKAKVEEAKQGYKAEVQILLAAELDDDEREVAILFARQKYISQIHGAFKQ
jgi:hypothetical protein